MFRFKISQYGPAGIRHLARAPARPFIQVRAARRTKALAVFPAQMGHRQGQFNLLAHEIVEVDRLTLIKPDRKIVILQFVLVAHAQRRQIKEIEALLHCCRKRLQAAIAFETYRRRHASDELYLFGRPRRLHINLGPAYEARVLPQNRLAFGVAMMDV